MFKSFVLLALFGAASAFAYPGQIYTLYPGQSMHLPGGGQVVCQGNYTPPGPPIPPPSGQYCNVKFNPLGSSCFQYVIYDSYNAPLTGCLMSLDEVRRNLMDLRQIGSCSRV